jgi:hypothetical protein
LAYVKTTSPYELAFGLEIQAYLTPKILGDHQ